MLINQEALCQHYINNLYQDTSHYLALGRKQDQCISETYGEILYESVAKILKKIPLHESDIFLDMGSGLGKLIVQVFLLSNAKTVCGIEINQTLHFYTTNIINKVHNDLPEFFIRDRTLYCVCGDFMRLPLMHATVVLLGSPCFSQRMLDQIGEVINHHPSIHTVLTLKPINTLKFLSFVNTIRIECSWDTALCFVYQHPLKLKKRLNMPV